MQCGNKNYVTFRKKNAGRLQPGIRRFDKLMFVKRMRIVTFLCPNKKVTKEIVRGEALRAKCRNHGALATGKRPILIRCAEHHLAPDPTPAAFDHRPLKMFRFSVGSAEQTCWLAA